MPFYIRQEKKLILYQWEQGWNQRPSGGLQKKGVIPLHVEQALTQLSVTAPIFSNLERGLVPLGRQEGELGEAELEPLQQHPNPVQVLAPLLPFLFTQVGTLYTTLVRYGTVAN